MSESELALQLGLGRTPVREALQRLAAEHLVEIMPRRGVRVSPIDLGKQLRLLELRRVLERLNVGLAARRANAAMRDRFAQIAAAMTAAGKGGDYQAFLDLDAQFNQLLLDAADNEFSATSLQQLHGLSRRFWHSHYQQADDLEHVARLHAAIAAAVAAGDPEGAETASGRHMDYVHEFTRSAWE